MNEKELFDEVLKYFVDYYKLEITHPYNDGYMIISKNGKEIGDFNVTGYNLLYNLTSLCETLKQELI